MEEDEEEGEGAPQPKEREVKMATIYLGFFPTAVAEEKLEEARNASLRRIFGTDSLRYIQRTKTLGTYRGILQRKIEEHCQEGNQFFSREEWERAITCFSKALNLDPMKLELYEQKAEAFLQLCDFQSAILHLRKAYSMSLRKESIGARLAFILQIQGQSLYEQKTYLEALEAFTCALELQPQNKLFRMRIIGCLGALKRYNDCLQMVNSEVDQEKKNPDLFVLRARLYGYFGKVTLCFHNLQDAIALDPEHAEAQIMLSNLKKEAQKSRDQALSKAVKGNLKAALLKINRAIDFHPVDARYLLFRGSILRRLKDFEAAVDDFLKAVDLSKEEEGSEVHAEAQRQLLLTYNDFAVHCYAKGCYEEAILLLNKAIKGEKNEKGLYTNRGDCFLKLGELNFAMADYQQALELRPLNPPLQKRMAWLYDEMGLQEFKKRQYHQAESYFSDAIKNNPREVRYYLHRAKSRIFLQEMMGAKEDAATAFLLDPARAETHTLAKNYFPGEQIQSIVKSKIGALAKTLLDRRLAACPVHSAPAKHEGLDAKGKEPPGDVYTENEVPEKTEEEEEKKEKEKQPHPEKRLQEKVAACQMKTRKVSLELREMREKRASLVPNAVRLDPHPSLPEEPRSDEPYQWKTFGYGIGHF